MFASPTGPAAAPDHVPAPTVTIVVKNVYRKTSIEMALPLTEALSSIKAEIQDKFEEHPTPEQQRLIFLGKECANDSLPLKDLLSQSKMDATTPQTFHLVLNGSFASSTVVPERGNEPRPSRSEVAEEQKVDEASRAAMPVAPSVEGLRHRHPHAPSASCPNLPAPGFTTPPRSHMAHPPHHMHSPTMYSMSPRQPETPAEMAAWHQWYAQWSHLAVQQQMYMMHSSYYQQHAMGMSPNAQNVGMPPMMPLYSAAMGIPPGYSYFPMSMPITTTYTASNPSHPTASQPHSENATVPANTNPVPPVNNVPPARPTALSRFVAQSSTILRLVDLKLAVKMALLVVILNPGDMERLISLSSVAIVAFLYQTGILAALVTMFLMREDPARPEGNNGGGERQEGEADTASFLLMRQQAGNTWWQKSAVLSRELVEGNIRAEGGLWVDLYVLVTSIGLSLFPTWQPRKMVVPEEPRPVPVAPPVEEVQG